MQCVNKNGIAKGQNLLFTTLGQNFNYFKIANYFQVIRWVSGVGSVRLKVDGEKHLLVATGNIFIVDMIVTITGV